MKLLLKIFLGAAFFLAGSQPSQAEEVFFFSFVNAIGTENTTILNVNGKKIGDPFAPGFFTGGMGFLEKSVAVSIENGELPVKKLSFSLIGDNSPIVISYISEEKNSDKKDDPPKKTIEALSIPCLTEKKGNLRAVYVGGKEPITLSVGAVGNSKPRQQLVLAPGVPVEVPVKASPMEFSLGETPVGAYDAEGNDNWLFVFFPDAHGKLLMATALDQVFH